MTRNSILNLDELGKFNTSFDKLLEVNLDKGELLTLEGILEEMVNQVMDRRLGEHPTVVKRIYPSEVREAGAVVDLDDWDMNYIAEKLNEAINSTGFHELLATAVSELELDVPEEGVE